MPYYTYNNNTGQLLEISEQLLFDGCPPSGYAVSFTNIPLVELESQYIWDAELRDFILKE